MGSVRTRRQAKDADASQELDSSPRPNGTISKRKAEVEDEEQENIFLFIPNVVGYVRVVLAVGSLYYMPLHPRTCSLMYSISCLLDAVDGLAARRFEQSTRFGAVLDMVTDRCTTSCLLVFLSAAWPRWSILFQGLISLDFASHYMHMYATLAMGGQDNSHKKVDATRSRLLYHYYTNKNVLFTLCALNELFFIALYLLSFSSPALVPALLAPADGGEPLMAQSPRVDTPAEHWWEELFDRGSQAYFENLRANKMDSTVPWILCAVSLPFMLVKNWINIVQMVKASQWLAQGDRADRRAKGLPRKKKA